MAVRAPVRQRQRSKSSARPPLRVVKGKGRKRRLSPIPIVVAVVLTVFSVTALHATMSQDGIKAAKLGLVGDPDALFLKVPLDAPQRLGPVAPGQPSADPIKSLDAGAR